MAKKILFGVAVVLALLGAIVIVGPSFIDSNALKREITAQARAATGRDLTIGGNLQIRFFPAPALTANNVRLSNAEGAEGADMVSLKAVEVRVALMPLLSGQVQVERIRLLSPEVNIEKFADGRTNLEFQPEGQAETSAMSADTGTAMQNGVEPGRTEGQKQSNDTGLDIRLDNFEVADGRVVYRDAATGTVERVENIDATLRAGSLNGPFEAQGQARVRGVPLAFEVSLGQIIEQRTVPVNAVVNAPGGARIQVTGAVLGLESEPHFKGKIKASGDNLAQLADAVSAPGAVPDLLAQTFALDSDIDASATSVALNELDVQFGKAHTTGNVAVTLGEGVEFDVQLKATRIDVDALLATVGTRPQRDANAQQASETAARIAPTPPQNGAKPSDQTQAFAFPKGVRGTVQATIDAVTVKGGLVSDVRLAAELADGELALSQLQAMAPGVTDVAVFGFLRPKGGVPSFEGDVEVISADPSTLTDWIGVTLPAGVAGRVKRVTYKSKVVADPHQVVVSGLEITADKSKLTGGVTLALRKRLSFGADLALDAINLDTYMNAATAVQGTAQGTAGEPSEGGAAQTQKPTEGPSALEAAQAWAGLSVLNDFDANLKVRVGALTQGGKTFKKLLFDGTLYAGALQLRSLQLGDYQGAHASLSGTFNGFGAIPEMSKVKVDATVKDAAKLADNLGVSGAPKGLKGMALNATAQGSLLKPHFDAKLSALKGEFAAKGSFSLLPIGFGYNGTVSARHGDTAALLNALDIAYKPAGPLGALDLNAHLNTDGKTHTITGLKSTLGDTAIDGDITARTAGRKPHVTANLQTGALIVDRFLAKAQKSASLEPPTSKWGKAPQRANIIQAAFVADEVAQSAQRAAKRWSRDRCDLSALNMVDGEMTLKSDAIQFGTYKLSNADIHATVQEGVLKADKVAGNLFGGPVNGSAIVRANGAPTLETDIKLDALKVAQAVQAVAGKDLASGKLSLNLGFNATGLSPADLVTSLNGVGNLSIDELDVKKGGKGTALSGVIGLVAAMNQLSLGSGKKGKGLADLALAFDIQDGIANAQKMTLNSAMGNGTGAGKVDIAGWGIDFAGNMTVEPNLLTSLLSKGRIGRQEVPFSVRGALDNPGIDLGIGKASTGEATGGVQQKIDPFRSLIEKALPGVKLPQKPAAQPSQPAQPQQQNGTLLPPPPQSGSAPAPTQKPTKPSTQDIIKQLMQGL